MKYVTILRNEWRTEYGLCVAWARWCQADDVFEIMRACGLSRYGSPPSLMPVFSEQRQSVGPVQYKASVVRSDLNERVDAYVHGLLDTAPGIARALICRHLHVVGTDVLLVRPEWWRAMSLYGLKRSAAHARLTADCLAGYRGLRRHLTDVPELEYSTALGFKACHQAPATAR